MWTELLKETLRISGPVLLAVALAVYVLKVVLERKFESTVRRLEEIGKTSLDVKKGLRQEEREELVALRVAVDKWEYFLQTAVIRTRNLWMMRLRFEAQRQGHGQLRQIAYAN